MDEQNSTALTEATYIRSASLEEMKIHSSPSSFSPSSSTTCSMALPTIPDPPVTRTRIGCALSSDPILYRLLKVLKYSDAVKYSLILFLIHGENVLPLHGHRAKRNLRHFRISAQSGDMLSSMFLIRFLGDIFTQNA